MATTTTSERRSRSRAAVPTSGVRDATAEARLEAVTRAIREMRARFREPLSLDDLAEAALFSPYHFNRFFRQITGLTPGRFLAAVRIQEAKRLLLETSHSVTAICFEVGYGSLGTFSRQFTTYVGVPPSRFRESAAATAGRFADVLGGGPPGSLRTSQADDPLEIDVVAPEGFDGPVFAGLFPEAIPRRRPLACAAGGGPGTLRIRGDDAEGRYLFVVGVEAVADSFDAFVDRRVVQARSGPIDPADIKAGSPLSVTLGPPRITDPPLLVSVPFLLRQAVAAPA